MNEAQISRMVKEYGEKMPAFAPRKRTRIAPVALSFSCAAALAAGLILLTPRKAEAGSYAQMLEALKGAKTMESTMYVDRYGSLPFGHEWLSGTSWAVEGRIAQPYMHVIEAWTPREHIVNYLAFGVSTREPRTWDFREGKKTILDWVVSESNFSDPEHPKPFKRLSSPTLNGVPTYLLRLEDNGQFKRPNPRLHDVHWQNETSIWVNAETNLPIRSENVHRESDRKDSKSYTNYQFNVPIPESAFAPRFQPAIDLPARQAELLTAFKAHPAAKGRNALLLDAQLAKDGSLYVLYSGSWAPTEVSGIDGQKYVRAWGYWARPDQPTVYSSMPSPLSLVGLTCQGVAFVPATLSPKRPSAFRVEFQHAPEDWNGCSDLADLTGPAETLVTKVKPCNVWPDYAFDLTMYESLIRVDIQRAEAQAKALEAAGDVDGALKMYREAEARSRHFVPYVAYKHLIPAEAMLRKAGRVKEADALEVEIRVGRARDPNEPPAKPPTP